jgi:uncharacterized membrane protein YkvA (DUF1232 family)
VTRERGRSAGDRKPKGPRRAPPEPRAAGRTRPRNLLGCGAMASRASTVRAEPVRPAAGLRDRVLRLFERRWLARAEAPEAARTVEAELDGKMAAVGRRAEGYIPALLDVARDLQRLWAHRGTLRTRHVVYLIAALLYFISPLDAVPDVIPGLGYADDLAVLVFVLGVLRESVGGILDHATDRLVAKGKEAAVEALDQASTSAVPRAIAAVAIGLWGMTTAAAVSLGVGAASGRWPVEWAVYVVTVAAVIGLWNLTVAARYVRRFRRLDGPMQERIVSIAVSRLGPRELVALGAPAAALIALGAWRVLGWTGA